MRLEAAAAARNCSSSSSSTARTGRYGELGGNAEWSCCRGVRPFPQGTLACLPAACPRPCDNTCLTPLDVFACFPACPRRQTAESKKNPVFTTALIAGDCVILDAIAKAGLLDKTSVVFIDTYFLFPETPDFLREVEQHYGFKAKVYHAADVATQEEFYDKYGADYWMVRAIGEGGEGREGGAGYLVHSPCGR